MTVPTALQIEEYKYLKESIFKAERTMQAVFIFSIITSFSLFSAMLTIVVKDDFTEMDNLILPWVFLTPMVIIIPLFEMIKGQRDSIIRDACYLIVFFEQEESFKLGFCTRLNKLRENMSQATNSPETGGPIPNTYFFIWTFSTVLFAYFMQIISLDIGQSLTEVSFNFPRAIFLIVPLVILGLLIAQNKSYKSSMKDKKDIYIKNFKLVKEQLKNTA